MNPVNRPNFVYFGNRSLNDRREMAQLVHADLAYRVAIGDWNSVAHCATDLLTVAAVCGTGRTMPTAPESTDISTSPLSRKKMSEYCQRGLAVHLAFGAWHQVAVGATALRAIAIFELTRR